MKPSELREKLMRFAPNNARVQLSVLDEATEYAIIVVLGDFSHRTSPDLINTGIAIRDAYIAGVTRKKS